MANKKRRARGKDGRFIADNPETEVNEAWEQPQKKLHRIAEPEKKLMGWQGYFALFVILLTMSLIGLV